MSIFLGKIIWILGFVIRHSIETYPCQEYEVVKDRLKMKVEELADAQEEFGGLTISRYMESILLCPFS